MLDCTTLSRVRSTRKKQEVFKWTKCMEDFVHGQLGADNNMDDVVGCRLRSDGLL